MTCHHTCKPDARFCPKCGTGFEAAVSASTPDVLTEDYAPIAVTPQPVPPIIIAAEEPPAAAALPVAPTTVIATAIPAARPIPAVTQPPETTVAAISPASPPASTPRSGKPIGLLVLAAVAGIAVLAGGGYFAMRTSGTSSPATPAASAVITPAEPNTVAPLVPPPVVSIPAPATAPSVEKLPPIESVPLATTPEPTEVPTAAMPPKPALVVPAKPKPMPAPKALPAANSNELDQVINDSLAEAMQCMNRKQFDCVIANTNAVLRMAPGNRRAQDMKRQAKEAQERALSQIQIQ